METIGLREPRQNASRYVHGALDAAAGSPGSPRILDAIHRVTALRLAQDLDAFVAYDKRLLTAAEEAGLPTVAPGAS